MYKKITFLLSLFSVISFGQTIEKFSIDSGGASSSSGNIQILYTIGETFVAETTSGNLSISEGFINANLRIKLNPKIFLQGPMLNPATTGLMNDILREDGHLPTTSPYADNATVNSTVFNTTGDNAIVDWVFIELRNQTDTSDIIIARSALLQRDGDVVDLDGISELTINIAPKNYYVVVKHRNHLGVMTAATLPLSETPTSVDFTNSSTSTYGSNAQVQLPSGSMALWAGDTNNSDQIIFSGANSDANVIKDYVLADPANGFNSVSFQSQGYLNEDIDLNGFAKFSGSDNDSNLVKDNVLAHPSNGFGSASYTINSTVPAGN